MADGSGTNRDPRTGRARVQQLRPTNKDATAVNSAQPLPGLSRPVISTSAAGQSTAAQSSAQASNGFAAAPRVIPRIVTGQGSGSTIIVNSCQRGNPLLKNIRNIGWEYGDIVPDYQVGVASCALFLSLRYHRLHPEYIHNRIQKLGNMFSLRILLVMCDVDQHQNAIKELTKVALVNNLTMMVAWSAEEAGAYLERYKTFERAPPDLIRERVNDDYMSHLTSALTSVKSVNKTDVVTLATNFGSLKRITQATGDELADCPGFGGTKIRRFQEAFRQPFRVGETRTRRERMAARRQEEQSNSAAQYKGPLRPRVTGVDPDEDEEAAAAAAHVRDSALTVANNDTSADAVAQDPHTSTSAAHAAGAGPAMTAEEDQERAGPAAEDDDVPDDIEDADDGWGDVLDNMTEEERLQLAMEMSMSGEQG